MVLRKRVEWIIIIILFIVGYSLIFVTNDKPIFIGIFNDIDGSAYVTRGFDLILSLFIFFPTAYYLTPKLLLKSRVPIFILSISSLVIVVSVAEEKLDYYTLKLFNLPTKPNEISDKELLYPRREVFSSTIVPGNLGIVIFAILLGVSRDWLDKSRREKILITERMEADLTFLKSQINPHFLFNTLNNIYSITQKNGDDEAGDAIIKLSDMMRYMIYESEGDTIELYKEVENIKNYIEVAKLRFAEDDDIGIELSECESYGNIKIAPLLLLPFVENSIKHGISPDHQGWIEIKLKLLDNQLKFSVRNSNHSVKDGLSSTHSGIGLKNVKRRLELIYQDQFSLDIDDGEELFSVDLVVNLG